MARYSSSRSAIRTAAVFLAVIAAMLAFASVAAAVGPSEPATITGRVVDSDGFGLKGILVHVDAETSDTTVYGFQQNAKTDNDGYFTITDIIQGTYNLYVNDSQYSPFATGYAEVHPWHDEWSSDPAVDTRQTILGGTTVDIGDVKLVHNGVINGRAMDGAVPIEGSEVIARVTTEGITYQRWATTGADGRFQIPSAVPGAWTLHYVATRGGDIPDDPLPGPSFGADYDPIAKSQDWTFDVAEGETVNLLPQEFSRGQLVLAYTSENFRSNTYNVSAIGVTAVPQSAPDWEHTYYWQTGDDGWGRAYLPGGDTWDLQYTDDALSCYEPYAVPAFATSIGGSSLFKPAELTPKTGTYALHGTIKEAVTANTKSAWVTASKINSSSTWLDYFRRVPSQGAKSGMYLIRLPKVTEYTGSRMKLTWSDQAAPPDNPYVHVTYEATITPPPLLGSTDTTRDVTLTVGGHIAGTVHDSEGNAVPGVTVWAVRKAYDPSFGEVAWTGTETWWTRTAGDGTYDIGGLPANADYKVNFNPDYNPGMALPIKYRDYNRRTYKNQPLVDSLNTSIGAPVSDHTPVAVTTGVTTSGIDETLTPGGYVALHADGPQFPTGAVWCDVMYSYKSHWFEIDSGYTTGGTFQKIWKVLPAGHYKLNYKDYFGRGSGTWEFDLAENEKKYASVLVPAPVTFMSGVPSSFKGAFAGIVGAGLPDGGTGGAMLEVATGTVPPAAPPLPINTISIPGSILDVVSTGSDTSGKWTLTLPYDPSVPDSDVPYISVVHYKKDGSVEYLSPIAWNLTKHTVQVQTSSLSPFRVAYKKHSVRIGTPVASSTWTRYKTYTVYGSLWPNHTTGVKSAKVMVYRRNSAGKYVWYKDFSAYNYQYRGSTRYRAKFSLKPGRYRFYGYAFSDKWHLATKSKFYKSVYVK